MNWERWFFASYAGLLLLIAVVGFTPTAIAILSGSMENPALVVHLHAATMLLWLLLFLAQATLIGINRQATHIKLGRALFLLAPVIVVLLVYLAITQFPGGEQGSMIIVNQLERVILFTSFVVGAAVTRRVNSSAHKRFILLATLVPIDAALNRMPWLPDFGLGWGTPIWMIVLLVPLFIYDLASRGYVHKVTAFCGSAIALFWFTMIVIFPQN